MTKHTTSWRDDLLLSGSFGAGFGRRDAKMADLMQDALAKQHDFDGRKAAVQDLRIQLDNVCADILKHGGNAERINQSRRLEIGLAHARRQLELAGQHLDAAIRTLRRAYDGRRPGDGAIS